MRASIYRGFFCYLFPNRIPYKKRPYWKDIQKVGKELFLVALRQFNHLGIIATNSSNFVGKPTSIITIHDFLITPSYT